MSWNPSEPFQTTSAFRRCQKFDSTLAKPSVSTSFIVVFMLLASVVSFSFPSRSRWSGILSLPTSQAQHALQPVVCLDHLTRQSVSQSVERLTGHGSQCPPRLAVVCDPPGIVGIEPSVVLDLLYPRSAGSSSLALPLRPDVRFTACASVHSQAQCGVSYGARFNVVA